MFNALMNKLGSKEKQQRIEIESKINKTVEKILAVINEEKLTYPQLLDVLVNISQGFYINIAKRLSSLEIENSQLNKRTKELSDQLLITPQYDRQQPTQGGGEENKE